MFIMTKDEVIRNSDEPPFHLDEPLRIEDGNIPNYGPSMTYVPKTINRDFRDMIRVHILRGSYLEKRRGTNVKTNIDSWKIL